MKVKRRDIGIAAKEMYQPASGPQAVTRVTEPLSKWDLTAPAKDRQGPVVQMIC